MKKYFLYKFFVYATFFTVGLLSLSCFWDPFKVFRNYDEFYDDNIINGNRESICLELFKGRKLALNDVENIIIGNSRSQAFKTDAWSEQIGVDKQKSFHYDGSSFGLYRTTNAIRYLMENNDSIKNLLIIMDVEFFSELSNPSPYMYIQPPEVSQENRLLYYYQFLKAGTHPIFLINYLIRRASGKHFGFMKYYLVAESGNHVSTNFTADLHYIYDKEIQRDSLGYYNNKVKNGVFYSRDTLLKISKPLLGYKQIELLNQMENMIQKLLMY